MDHCFNSGIPQYISKTTIDVGSGFPMKYRRPSRKFRHEFLHAHARLLKFQSETVACVAPNPSSPRSGGFSSLQEPSRDAHPGFLRGENLVPKIAGKKTDQGAHPGFDQFKRAGFVAGRRP